jgi:CheY-like chemotaxis protein
MDSLGPILLAEDDENDVIMFGMAFDMARLRHQLAVVRDGGEAVDYLSGTPPFDNRRLHPLPAIIILDIKMPRLNGFDVLCWLSQSSGLSQIPIVVLSSSSESEDVARAMGLGASGYFVKPRSFKELIQTLQTIAARWLPSAGSPLG